jgi:hypothetical protein
MRNHGDFCAPAIKGLNKKAAIKVGIALDVAILFGVLEYIEGNESLRLPPERLKEIYQEKLERLQARENS